MKMKKQETDKTGYRDGQWKVVHLGFLIDFMNAAGLSTTSLAERLGLSRQAVWHWFSRDDMKLSQIYRLFETCGYRIEFSLVKDSPQNGLPVCVTMAVNPPQAKARLDFLRIALDRYVPSKEALAQKIGVGKATLYNWFKADDCFLSYVYAVAVAEEMRLSIKIEPLS